MGALLRGQAVRAGPSCATSVETSPLVKSHRSKPGVVEKWDLYVRGFELATGYSELNDPVVQRERFVARPKTRSPAMSRPWISTRTSLRRSAWVCRRQAVPVWASTVCSIALTGATIRETITFPLTKPLNLQ